MEEDGFLDFLINSQEKLKDNKEHIRNIIERAYNKLQKNGEEAPKKSEDTDSYKKAKKIAKEYGLPNNKESLKKITGAAKYLDEQKNQNIKNDPVSPAEERIKEMQQTTEDLVSKTNANTPLQPKLTNKVADLQPVT